MPVELRIRSAPCCSTSQLVAEVGPYYPGLMLVAPGNRLPIGKPVQLGILIVVPEPIAIVVATAPVGSTHMVVENHHKVGSCERTNDGIYHVQGALAFERKVCL